MGNSAARLKIPRKNCGNYESLPIVVLESIIHYWHHHVVCLSIRPSLSQTDRQTYVYVDLLG